MGKERFNWRKTFGGGKHLGRKDLIEGKHLGEESIWGGLNHMVGENIWGRKDLIGGKHLGEENTWGRKTFGEGKI